MKNTTSSEHGSTDQSDKQYRFVVTDIDIDTEEKTGIRTHNVIFPVFLVK